MDFVFLSVSSSPFSKPLFYGDSLKFAFVLAFVFIPSTFVWVIRKYWMQCFFPVDRRPNSNDNSTFSFYCHFVDFFDSSAYRCSQHHVEFDSCRKLQFNIFSFKSRELFFQMPLMHINNNWNRNINVYNSNSKLIEMLEFRILCIAISKECMKMPIKYHEGNLRWKVTYSMENMNLSIKYSISTA